MSGELSKQVLLLYSKRDPVVSWRGGYSAPYSYLWIARELGVTRSRVAGIVHRYRKAHGCLPCQLREPSKPRVPDICLRA